MNDIQAWAISSKNVCLLAQSSKDLEDQELQKNFRYSFAVLIADAWFKILEKVQKEEGKVEELQKFLDNKTMVAEYCGNQGFQHLVKYTEIDLIFYAIVENDSIDTTIDPEEAFAVFKKFGLTYVKYQVCGEFKTFEHLNKELGLLYGKVAKASI